MSIRPKSRALEGICFTQTKAPATGKLYPHYCADLGTQGGRRIRVHATTLAECKRRVNDWYDARAKSGDAIAALSMKELADAMLAFDKLRSSSINKTLYEIVCQYVERSGKGLERKLLADAYDLYFARLTDEQDTQKQLVRVRVGRFVAKHPQKYVDEVSVEMVKRYLDGMGDIAPKTWNNNLQYISTFLNWCAKKTNGFCSENPLQDMEKRKSVAKIPECATIAATREFFGALMAFDSDYRDLVLLRCALNYFAGMRGDSEVLRQDVADIRIEDGSVLVRKPKGYQTSRVSYRTFRIEDCGPALASWLKIIDLDKAARTNMSDSTYKNVVSKLRAQCRHKIPNNAGRHSFISYHVAAYGEPKRTEAVVGTSEEMRKHNYQTLMTKADGEAYFAITPASVASE